MRRLCFGLLLMALCAALAMPAHAQTAYSQPFALEGLLHPDFFGAAQVQNEAPPAPPAEMPEARTAQAQFVTTAIHFKLEPEGAVVYYDTALSGFFAIRAEADGRCYLDGQSIPVVSQLDRDCIAPGNSKILLCDSRQLGMWGWRTSFVADGAVYDAGFGHMSLGEIDAATGELIGYRAQAGQVNTVYIAWRSPVHRYEVAYYDADGNALAHGSLYALTGSNLRQAPTGVALPVPQGATLSGFTLLGTRTDAPDFAIGPARLQMKLEGACRVAFMDGDAQHGAQWVQSGGTIDWSAVAEPRPAAGWLFAGWALSGAQGVIDPAARVRESLTLHARYVRARTVTFLAGTEDAPPWRTVTIADGATIDPEQIAAPPVNQRFLGWVSAQGDLLTAQTAIVADATYTAAFAPWVTEATLVARDRCVADATDTVNGYSREYPLGDVAVRYDPARDDYYILSAGIAPAPLEDRLYNRFVFDLAAASWRWLDDQGQARAFIPAASEARWYFGLNGAQASRVQVVYATEIIHYMVYFADTASTPLDVAYPVLAGGSLSAAARDETARAMLPQEDQAAFDGWAGAETITGPTVLTARRKQRHAVRLYLDVPGGTLHAALTAYHGDAIDWTRVAEPSLAGHRFLGWDGIADMDAPILAETALVARFVALRAVTILDAQGGVLQTQYLADGETLRLETLVAPQRQGLRFAHWAMADGRAVTGDIIVDGDCAIKPVYTATVTFFDGTAICGTMTVMEGACIPAMPDAPAMEEGRVFLGWNRDLAGVPIHAGVTVSAETAIEITFVYGLLGEARRVVVIRAGERVTPPDAAIDGFSHSWGVDLSAERLFRPVTLVAQYEWLAEAIGAEGAAAEAYSPEAYGDDGGGADLWLAQEAWSVLDEAVAGYYGIAQTDVPLATGIVAGQGGDCFE